MKKTSKKDPTMNEKVMELIEKEEIKMRPKMYFYAGTILLAFGLMTSVTIASLFTHISLYRVRGGTNLPLLPVLVSVGSLAGGIYFLKKFDIAYKKNYKLLLLLILVPVVVGTALLVEARFEERVERVRVLQELYHQKGGRRRPSKRINFERKIPFGLYY